MIVLYDYYNGYAALKEKTFRNGSVKKATPAGPLHHELFKLKIQRETASEKSSEAKIFP